MSLSSEIVNAKKKLKSVETVTTSLLGYKFIEVKKDNGEINLEVVVNSCPGFVIDSKPDLKVAQILEYLYLGSQDPAFSMTVLEDLGITHVLSVGVDLPKSMFSPKIKYAKVNLLDEPEAPLINILNSCSNYIESVRKQNEINKIFVHCNAGYSRGPSIVLGYLIKFCNFSFDAALDFVKKKRNIKPNDGFMKQLKKYNNYSSQNSFINDNDLKVY